MANHVLSDPFQKFSKNLQFSHPIIPRSTYTLYNLVACLCRSHKRKWSIKYVASPNEPRTNTTASSILISTAAATRLCQTRPTLICRSLREPVPSHLNYFSLGGLSVKLVYDRDNRVLRKMSLREVVKKTQYVLQYLPEDNE